MLPKTSFQFLLSSSLFLGISHGSCPATLPKVTLPWGTVTPNECDDKLSVYIFRNIRFGKRTDGKDGGTARFASPEFPNSVANPEDVHLASPSGPTACLGVPLGGKKCGEKGKGRTPNWAAPILAPAADATSSEDCLFLDIFVPVSAVENAKTSKLPVIVWFYGGAYLFGSKDIGLSKNLTLYDGRGLLEAANNKDIIYVAGNYRLAHLGWLAGSTVAESSTAIPNAGLADQRLLLQFVQDNIAKFGGDPSRVTAFGESAGGGSILHHLIATNDKGDRRDPLFHQAITQSAAFQWIWDSSATGQSEKVFESFVASTSCKGKSGSDAIECLQGLDTPAIEAAVGAYWESVRCTGIWNLGPVVDGRTIRQLPAVALESPDFSFHPRVKGIIASHVTDEAKTFVPHFVKKKAGFDTLLESFLPGDSDLRIRQRACISHHYRSFDSNQVAKAKNVIQDSMFVCNVRFTYDAAARQNLPIWLMNYAFFHKEKLAVHGTDLVPTFWSTHANKTAFTEAICLAVKDDVNTTLCKTLLKDVYFPAINKIRLTYQKYFVGFAVGGDPNESKYKIRWENPTDVRGTLKNVMEVTGKAWGQDNFNLQQDGLTTKGVCQFWSCMADAVVNGRTGEECGCGGPSAPQFVDEQEESGMEEEDEGKDEL